MIIEEDLIKKAKDKLGDNMAFIIKDELGIEDFDEKNLKCCCPFHHEDTPSFIWNKKTGSFHCFGACGRNYDILDVFMLKGMTFLQAVQRLFELADITYSFGEFGVKTRAQYKYPKEEPLNDKENVYAYLALRKLSKETVDYLDIREDPRGNCVFNYYDLNDTLTVVKYRPSHKIDKAAKENKNWCQPGADTSPLLYNMNRINTTQPLLITSGELDAASAIESGWANAVSIPFGDQNVQWVEENFDWLEQFEQIIICPDNDKSGQKYCKQIVPMLGAWRCRIVQVSEDCKDLNEMLYRHGKESVLEAIVHAPDTPVPSLVDFSDVEDLDTSDLDGITCGLKELDRELGKFYFSSFNLISGIPGSGKTSIINNFVCSAVDQGYGVWLFSRELPCWMTRSWILHQFAGEHHIKEYNGKNDSVFYKVDLDAKKEISDYYRGQIHLYKDEWPNDVESLETSMVDAARKYGCKVFIIDNLMMVDLHASSDNMNQKQTDFVNWLIQFSMRYSVVTFLVAHPNKTQSAEEGIGWNGILGSSSIINLAHRAIGLRRITKKEKTVKSGDFWRYNVVAEAIKDRITGKANFEAGLYYSKSSHRFFTDYEEYAHSYSWDKEDYPDAIPMPECLLDEQEEEDAFGGA